jgi:hypothetical protein
MKARRALLWLARGVFWILATVIAAMFAVAFASCGGVYLLRDVEPRSAIVGVVIAFAAMWILGLWTLIWVCFSREFGAPDRNKWLKLLLLGGPISAFIFLFRRLHPHGARREPTESQDLQHQDHSP